jgi:hypothetical protein
MKEEIVAVGMIGDYIVGSINWNTCWDTVSEYTIRSIKDGILAIRSEVNIQSRVLKMGHLL